ncbi:sensor histidine kinase [Paraburkholderia sp. PREW-6R]|uniref:sensor histidine kinase n=1 Tax=Paraburkholderia sp. PREW-6R TaxID=3141544 RepID=UPI0031F55593
MPVVLRRALERIGTLWTRAHQPDMLGERAADTVDFSTRAAATDQGKALAERERARLFSLFQACLVAPFSAVAELVESSERATAKLSVSAQSRPNSTIRSAVRILDQVLHDLLDDSPIEARTIVLDETATNVGELSNAVIALLGPSAAQHAVRVSVSMDQKLANTILADHVWLGQMLFFLLSKAIRSATQDEITLLVAAESLNPASQRISFVVKESGQRSPGITPARLSVSAAGEPDSIVRLCHLLARRMQGELIVASTAGTPLRAVFSAPFTVDTWTTPELQATELAPVSASHFPMNVAQAAHDGRSASFEPFEPRYLNALSEEGIDLPLFLASWRREMNDDLGRLHELRRASDAADLSRVCHRLSGAVGLVGAQDLMGAFQRASTSPRRMGTNSIDALTTRARALIAQLDTAALPHRSQ